MATAVDWPVSGFEEPISLTGQKFQDNKWAIYKWMLEERPICRAKMFMNLLYFARYKDCVELSKDPRFVRNRKNAGGKRQLPVPLPKSLATLVGSMIYEDGEKHRRLRNLVNQGFRPNAIGRLEERIDRLTHELLDAAEKNGGSVMLRTAYAHPIPVTVIGEVVGVEKSEMAELANSIRVLTEGLSGWRAARTILWDLRGVGSFVRNVVRRKRQSPGDDILTDLIQAEDDGDQLTEDELVAMVFLLIIAGHETTVHLINNGVLALFEHPEQLDRLRAEPELIDSAVEEMLRFCGPVHGSKPAVAVEDISWNGFEIKKGTNVMPNWASANRDPEVFDAPDVFDIGRNPNHHLAFAHGTHFCLGAQLARLETKIAIRTLVERYPNMKMGVDPGEVSLVNMPAWHRHEDYPVILR